MTPPMHSHAERGNEMMHAGTSGLCLLLVTLDSCRVSQARILLVGAQPAVPVSSYAVEGVRCIICRMPDYTTGLQSSATMSVTRQPPVHPGFTERLVILMHRCAHAYSVLVFARQHTQIEAPRVVVWILPHVLPHKFAAFYLAQYLQFCLVGQRGERSSFQIKHKFDRTVAAQTFAVARCHDPRKIRLGPLAKIHLVVPRKKVTWRRRRVRRPDQRHVVRVFMRRFDFEQAQVAVLHRLSRYYPCVGSQVIVC